MKKTVVATLSENTTKFYVNGENDSTMWPGSNHLSLLTEITSSLSDGIPPDGSP